MKLESKNDNPAIFENRMHIFGSACHLLISSCGDDDSKPLDLAQNELARLEAKFASFRPDSVVDNINRAAGTGKSTPLDAESRSLFSYVTALWEQSNHLFDPTTRALLDCYNSDGELTATPDTLKETLELVGWSNLEISASGARLPSLRMEINLDNIIRPYAVDSTRKLLIRHGVENALIGLDQDVASIGRQPDGANWLVGMKYPKGRRPAITRLKMNDRGFSIRGNFERRVNVSGENFGRTLSPVDALPLPGLLSVAVIADNCLTACSAANIARLKTESAGLDWLEELGLPWMAIDRALHCHGPLAPI